ncbi:GntR family transcriptional regulator [Leucobacter japonicus]|uniref:GntR family transcriptional regulator n=1 Tax=Leucobacter japonicus TaxID=1461259 RepID=UPI0006A76F1D|nr:GntR family transcriptional regulator [Leucobacter japonicus]
MSWQTAHDVAEHLPGTISTQLQHRRLLRQDVYDVLVNEFINGDFAPGDRIRDDEVAQRLNVSRTPVREALAKLATAGLVDTAPNRYTRTTDLYEGDLDVALELLASTYRIGLLQLVRDISADDRQVLELLERRIRVAQPNDAYAVLQAFGRFCAERMSAPTLRRVIDIVQPRLQRVLKLNPDVLHSVNAIAVVRRLIVALVAGDEPAIESVCATMLVGLRTAIGDAATASR